MKPLAQRPSRPGSSDGAIQFLRRRTLPLLNSRPIALSMGALALVLGSAACTEVHVASPEMAEKLALARADLEEENALVQYQAKKKEQAKRAGQDADALYDDAEPLRKSPEFQAILKDAKSKVAAAKKADYEKRPARTVEKCLIESAKGGRAEAVDACIEKSQAPEEYNLAKSAAVVLIGAVVGIGVLVGLRSARRRIDPVVQAGQHLNLTVEQGQTHTVLAGEYQGVRVKVESSPPEAGQGDRFLRVVVVSKVNPQVLVRFGPLAPPSGLEMPDLHAPEMHDQRVPEGYKLRLSEGTKAEELLSGDVGFQLRNFDPVDVRVHDGVCGVTIWQVPPSGDRVKEFIDLAVTVAKLYPAA